MISRQLRGNGAHVMVRDNSELVMVGCREEAQKPAWKIDIPETGTQAHFRGDVQQVIV